MAHEYADNQDDLLMLARKGCLCEHARKPCTYHEGYADGIEAAWANILAFVELELKGDG